jgi:hypothetical protein
VVAGCALVVGGVGYQHARADAAGGRDATAGSTSTRPPVGALPRVGTPTAVLHDDVGDPFILPVPGGIPGHPGAHYAVFWTTDWRSNVPTAISSDLKHWTRIADGLPVLPSWATPTMTQTLGPSAIAVPGGWELFFSTQEKASGLECISHGFATSPVGPFVDRSTKPLICQRSMGGDIDPSVVRDRNGISLVWKSNGAPHNPLGIWEQSLDASGTKLLGSPHRILAVDQSWERGMAEGPAMVAATDGGWWLFYSSGGVWQANTYSTGVAWCAAVAGPCRQVSAGPWLTSASGAFSPGGFETFVNNDGTLWASYSVFPRKPANFREAFISDRVLEVAPMLRH